MIDADEILECDQCGYHYRGSRRVGEQCGDMALHGRAWPTSIAAAKDLACRGRVWPEGTRPSAGVASMGGDGRASARWPCMVCGRAWREHTLEQWRGGCLAPRTDPTSLPMIVKPKGRSKAQR